MKKDQENICKFVMPDAQDAFQLLTTNFVLETKADQLDRLEIRKQNKLFLVVSGKGQLHTELKTHSLQAGTVFLTLAGEASRVENTEELQYMYITFDGSRADALIRRFGISAVHCVFPGHAPLITYWHHALSRANEKNLDLISESVLLYTFAALEEPEADRVHHLISRILRHIEDHLRDTDLSLASAAAELGYHPKYISRIFRQHVGFTFSEYVKNARIQHAVFLMELGITSIKNVAFLSGFSDPLYFSNVFRKKMGITPSEFLSQNGSGEKENDQ